MNLGHVTIKATRIGIPVTPSSLLHALIFPIYDPGTSGGPGDYFSGSVKSELFSWVLLDSICLYSHDCMVEFSRGYMIGGITMNRMQKQIWESRCLLLSQTLKRFANIKQCFCLFAGFGLYGVLNNFEECKAAWDQTIWEPLICGTAGAGA